jgi:CubicO group peptidase (beta-lactamase class C family)
MIASVRRHHRSTLTLVVALTALFGSTAAHAQRPVSPAATTPPPVAVAPPESAGMSAARLTRLTALFKKEIDDKKLPGAVMLVARKGKLVYASALGVRDPKSSDPMRTDTIFRIYSMTKPIVSVAAMLLVEDGRLQLTDPVAKWLPAFKDVKVWTDAGEVAAQRAMTLQDLLRHTAGLPYGELTQNAASRTRSPKRNCSSPASSISTSAT